MGLEESPVPPTQSKARWQAASSSPPAHSSAAMPAGLSCIAFSPWSIVVLQKKARAEARAFTLAQEKGLLAHDLAEALPFLAVEARQLHRLDRREIVARGVDVDAGQHRVD